MDKIESIKKEIEELRKHYLDREEYDLGWNKALDKVLSILDSLQEEPVSEDLEEAAKKYGTKKHPMTTIGANESAYDFKAGAEWQKEKHERQFSFINLKDCKDAYNEWKGTQKEPVSAAVSWVRACQWQKQQDQETIELAEDHAMLAGMEKMKEQMITAAIEWIRRNVDIYNSRWVSVFREAMNKV